MQHHKPTTFQDFCSQFTDKELPHVVKLGKRYFYDPRNLMAKARNWEVFSVGLYLGEERRDFQPTSALINLLAEHNDKRVVIGSKSAWLFLCGRDILMDGVLEAGDHRQHDLVFVADHHGNILGYGRVIAPYDGSKHNKQYVKHLLDKGEYLRREK